MRRAFSDTLVEIADSNDKLMFLTGDLGYQVFTELEQRHPEKYINAGIAEGQLATCAAGLALSGYRPVIYSIASFMTGRAFEQIRVSINYHQLPVLVVGAGGGYIYANSGVTHHAAEDFGIMSTMPGMQLFNPGAPDEVKHLLTQYFETGAPGYMRVGRFGEPSYEAMEPVTLGQARLVKDGRDVAILSTGDAVISVVNASRELSQQEIFPAHYQFHTLMPFDHQRLDEIFESFQHVVVVEEHFPRGGLYSNVCEQAVAQGYRGRVHRLGPEHELVLGAPGLNQLREEQKYDSNAIVKLCQKLVKA